ncbi:membrane protein insertion efficiency factor YidD [Bengtsoniella intestinalis]|uniref:membrane protein insertion efficiency factor YidD n=1 Tax=Bengtsoniella intestinalis TaxID=3073143 RepID=UPI00391F4ECD
MKQVLLWLVRFYRRAISPYRTGCCRFIPTCSQYALEALELHGALWGSCLTIWRILRCNPLCKAGYDPVPQHKPWQKPPVDKPTEPSSD